jgi:hypothetical protein
MKKRPRSIDTARPVHNNPILSTTDPEEKVRTGARGERERERMRDSYLPAERNTICNVGGTLNANTRLFSRVPDAKVVTCSKYCEMGTLRGLRRGSQSQL